MQTNTLVKIDKYNLDQVTYAKREVLEDQEEREDRLREIQRGMRLGNTHKLHSRIIFETEDGEIIETEATIWAVTEKRVMLKNDLSIPIRCIYSVIL
jgi:hypothetical protein